MKYYAQDIMEKVAAIKADPKTAGMKTEEELAEEEKWLFLASRIPEEDGEEINADRDLEVH